MNNLESLAAVIRDRPSWAKHAELTNRSWLRYLVDLSSKMSYVAVAGQYLDHHDNCVAENPQFVDGVGLLDPLETVITFFEIRNEESELRGTERLVVKKYAHSTMVTHVSYISQFFLCARGIRLSEKCTALFNRVHAWTRNNLVPKTRAFTFTSEQLTEYYHRPVGYHTAHIAPYAAIAVHGCSRGCEIKSLTFEQVKIFTGPAGDEIVEVKMIRAKGAVDRDNTFWIVEELAVTVVKQYMGLTTVIQQTGAFWRYSENVGNQWVLTQKQVGIHPLARCGIQIATFLQLENPNSYTGHCFKRTGGTLMAEGNATPFQIQNRMGKQAVKYI